MTTISNEDEANVAGDDAHYCEVPGFEDVADRVILANGILEPTKVFRSDQIGAVCLKRGVTQIGRMCLPKLMLVFPSFSNIGELFGYRTPQFTYSSKTESNPRSKVGAELFRFLRALSTSGISNHLDEVYDLLNAIYESARFPKVGSLPPYGDILIPVLPDASYALLSITPLDFLLRNHFSSGVVAPKIIMSSDSDEVEHPVLVSGGTWISCSTKKLRYLEVLEYVSKTMVNEVLWGLDAYQRLVDVYTNRGLELYEYLCIRDVPEFLESIPTHL
jgi:hypothetical protein